MAVLTTKSRNALPTSAFAIPETRNYPIHDESHARDALAEVAANGTDAEKAKVRAAVHKKYPSIGADKPDPKDAVREAVRKAYPDLEASAKRGFMDTP